MSWIQTQITQIQPWSDGLATVRLDLTLDFEPGQFVNLGKDVDGERIKRAYSIGSAPNQPLEFFIVRVDEGRLTPDLLSRPVGAKVWVHASPKGFFTLKWVHDAPVLWLIATGTGLSPYISMLRTEAPWRRFSRIVLVHGVRHLEDLAYTDELKRMVKARDGQLALVQATSRYEGVEALHGRVTALLRSGALESAVGEIVRPNHQVMMCGNPAMLAEMQSLLEARGLAVNRRKKPGQITIERYW